MPLKLNVGVSRKVGLPNYGSVGASCNLEMELEAGLLEKDLDGFHARIRGAYVAAHQAVHDELARLHAPATTESGSQSPARARSFASNGTTRANGNGAVDHAFAGRSNTGCETRDREPSQGDRGDRTEAEYRLGRSAPSRVRDRAARGTVDRTSQRADRPAQEPGHSLNQTFDRAISILRYRAWMVTAFAVAARACFS